MATRAKDPKLDILLESPGEEHLNITGSKLPSYNQVLLCYLAKLNQLRNEDSSKNTKLTWTAGKFVTSKVLIHYEKAHIPTIKENTLTRKIISFHEKEYLKCVKISKNCRSNNSQIESFREKLSKTMPFYPTNVEDLMNDQKRGKNEKERQMIDEDIAFLRNMMSERSFTYSRQDMTCSILEARRNEKAAKASARIEKEEKRKKEALTDNTYMNEPSELDSSDSEFIPMSDQTPKRSHRRNVKVGTPAHIPHDILKNKLVVETAVRNNITPTAAAELTRSIISASSGDLNKVSCSYNSSYKYRTEAVDDISRKIKDSWEPPAVAALHWDGKLMDTLGNESAFEERLPILVSGIGGVKLLGVPPLQHKTDERSGDKIAKATIDLLSSWNCEDNVKAMVFDTTASNTGAQTAGCVRIQEMLDRPLLWLACRHHVGERILVHAWDAIGVEVSKSPDISVFSRLKEHFESLQYNNVDNLNHPQIPEILAEKKIEIISLCEDALKTHFVRGDYKELLTLTLVYLNAKPESFKAFQRPGAFHKARWMAKMIYSFKIVLMGKEISSLPPGTVVGKGQLEKLETFMQFVVFCYVPWWITAPVAAAAPLNDLKLIESVNNYKKINLQISNAAHKAIGLHMWYLTQELVPLCLFDSHASTNLKTSVAYAILASEKVDTLQQREGSGYGKPVFPKVPNADKDKKLSDFVGSDSRLFFKILGIDSEFLSQPVAEWNKNSNFILGENIVKNLHVVNDAAERGVKLCNDFLGAAKSEAKLQKTLQVVENARSRLPNQRKRKMLSEKWWLQHDSA